MESDDLATLWQSGNRTLADVPLTFGGLAARERAQRTLFSIAFGRWFTLVSNAIAVLVLGAYTGDHLREPHVGLAALVLFVTSIALLIVSIMQVIIVSTLDLSASPLEVQQRVAAAERIRIANDTVALCASPMLWTLIAIVGAKALLGFDAVLVFGTPWIVANLALGLVTLGLGAVFIRPVRKLMAGSTLARVNARLADLVRFSTPG
jgi:hypothetical protein